MTESFINRIGNSPEEGMKSPCVTITTTNITLTGEQTIGAVGVVAGDRVIVNAQTDATENGLYNVDIGAWTRTVDFNKADDVLRGVLVADSAGEAIYRAEFSGAFIADTTEVSFIKVLEFGDETPAFGKVAVSGQTTAAATIPNDTLTLVAGTNVTITLGTKTATINSTGGGGGSTEKGVGAGVDSVTEEADATGVTLDIDGSVRVIKIEDQLTGTLSFNFGAPADTSKQYRVHVIVSDGNDQDWECLSADTDTVYMPFTEGWWWKAEKPPSVLQSVDANNSIIAVHYFEFFWIPNAISVPGEGEDPPIPFDGLWVGRYGAFEVPPIA